MTAPINHENDYMLLPRKMLGEIAVEQLTTLPKSIFAKPYFKKDTQNSNRDLVVCLY